MQEPRYIYCDKEAIRVPKSEDSLKAKMKKAVFIVIAVIIGASLVFNFNILGEMSRPTKLLLIALCLMFLGEKKEKVPSEFELRFYDEYLVLYRRKRYYDRRVTRKEYNKFYYKDIKTIEYRTKTKRINLLGVYEAIWYNYNKDGSLPDNPTHHRTADSIAYFYTDFLEHPDIVSIIEQHCPIKVSIENN